jgi:hypothetical protein
MRATVQFADVFRATLGQIARDADIPASTRKVGNGVDHRGTWHEEILNGHRRSVLANQLVPAERNSPGGVEQPFEARYSADMKTTVPSVEGRFRRFPDHCAVTLGTYNQVISGALTRPRVDVVARTLDDGLKLAIEIKSVHEAAGRAMWNRVSDLRSFGVNFHLKFPYAVCGGIIAVPGTMPGESRIPWLIHRLEQVLDRVSGRVDEGAAGQRFGRAPMARTTRASDAAVSSPARRPRCWRRI